MPTPYKNRETLLLEISGLKKLLINRDEEIKMLKNKPTTTIWENKTKFKLGIDKELMTEGMK